MAPHPFTSHIPTPSLPFQVGFAVFVNIVASIFAIVGIVLYAIHLGTVNMSWRCRGPDGNYSCYYLAAVAQVSMLPHQCGFFPL